MREGTRMVPLKNEREPGWFPLIARRLRRGAALFPVYRWDCLRIGFSPRRLGVGGNKVMAGGTPANPAALVYLVSKGRRGRPLLSLGEGGRGRTSDRRRWTGVVGPVRSG